MNRTEKNRFTPSFDVLEDRSVPSATALPARPIHSEHLTRAATDKRYVVRWTDDDFGPHKESWDSLKLAQSSAREAVIMGFKNVRITDTKTGKQVPIGSSGTADGVTPGSGGTFGGSSYGGNSRTPAPVQNIQLVKVLRQSVWWGTADSRYFWSDGPDLSNYINDPYYRVMNYWVESVPANRVYLSPGGTAYVN